jgi:hypothetical protein
MYFSAIINLGSMCSAKVVHCIRIDIASATFLLPMQSTCTNLTYYIYVNVLLTVLDSKIESGRKEEQLYLTRDTDPLV